MIEDNTAPIASATRRLRRPDRLTVSWLATQLASYLEIDATAIDPMVPLAEMGVDSVHVISLVGAIEVHYDVDVDPTLIFDYPTLSHIAEYIGNAAIEEQVAVA
jgi:acyl carrier protein